MISLLKTTNATTLGDYDKWVKGKKKKENNQTAERKARGRSPLTSPTPSGRPRMTATNQRPTSQRTRTRSLAEG